jgi:Xaa-Pro aminopeptidase
MMDKVPYGISAWKEIDWIKLTKFNVARLQSLMKKARVDVLLAQYADNFQYATGYMAPFYYNTGNLYTPHRQGALILADEEQPVMLAGAADIFEAKNFSWIEDVRPMPMRFETWPRTIKQALADHGVKEGRFAVDPYTVYTLVDGLRAALGKSFEFLNGESILETARSVKNTEEIKVIYRAAGLASAMMVTAKEAVKEGVREIDVAQAAELRLYSLEPLAHPSYKTTVMSGDRGAYLDRIPTQKIITRGELVNIDAGCYYMGYMSEFSRTVMVGKPTKEQKRLYKAAFEAEQKAMKAIKPGVKTSEIDRISRQVIKEAGYEKYQQPHFTGHGQGLAPRDLPSIGDPGQTKEFIIEPNMVIALEPGIFKPGVGGVREEDVILVTEDGHEVLSKVEYDQTLLD